MGREILALVLEQSCLSRFFSSASSSSPFPSNLHPWSSGFVPQISGKWFKINLCTLRGVELRQARHQLQLRLLHRVSQQFRDSRSISCDSFFKTKYRRNRGTPTSLHPKVGYGT